MMKFVSAERQDNTIGEGVVAWQRRTVQKGRGLMKIFRLKSHAQCERLKVRIQSFSLYKAETF